MVSYYPGVRGKFRISSGNARRPDKVKLVFIKRIHEIIFIRQETMLAVPEEHRQLLRQARTGM
jgi:hypothetical protein